MKKLLLSLTAIASISLFCISTFYENQQYTNSISSNKKDNSILALKKFSKKATVSAKQLFGWENGSVDVEYNCGKSNIYIKISKVHVDKNFVAKNLKLSSNLRWYDNKKSQEYIIHFNEIGDYAFKDVQISGNIDFTESNIVRIGKNAFDCCNIYGSLGFSKSLQEIGESAFTGNCVKNIYFDGKYTKDHSIRFGGNWRPGIQNNAKVWIDLTCEQNLNAFLSNKNFGFVKSEIKSTTDFDTIPVSSSKEEDNIKVCCKIFRNENLDVIGASLSKIENYKYKSCVIQIPSSVNINNEPYDVVEIANYGFMNCAFQSVDLSHANNLIRVGDDAFNSVTTALEYSYINDFIFIPKSVKYIGSYAFSTRAINYDQFYVFFESNIPPEFGYNWSPYKYQSPSWQKIHAVVPKGSKESYIKTTNFKFDDKLFPYKKISSDEQVIENNNLLEIYNG